MIQTKLLIKYYVDLQLILIDLDLNRMEDIWNWLLGLLFYLIC